MTTDGGGPDPGRAGPDLVLGPLLRYVAETQAPIWVETDTDRTAVKAVYQAMCEADLG